ncbi:hypothetical protein AB0H76_33940 [Nocardia sp. NPDC050712]|uniref:hypothetical protein n=1 Tax=Nocardia sp. NPDC050712 TaxID=3155518 RepID=UPI0033F4583B
MTSSEPVRPRNVPKGWHPCASCDATGDIMLAPRHRTDPPRYQQCNSCDGIGWRRPDRVVHESPGVQGKYYSGR